MSLLERLRGSTVTSGLLSAEPSHEGDRATTLELFFDLVYAFAFTQVTAFMARRERSERARGAHPARAALGAVELVRLPAS
jgi:low temperature requirement protein LtrA